MDTPHRSHFQTGLDLSVDEVAAAAVAESVLCGGSQGVTSSISTAGGGLAPLALAATRLICEPAVNTFVTLDGAGCGIESTLGM